MLLSLDNVTFGYLGVPTVENVSFSLHENDRAGLLGANGAGKTTLLRLILGELTPDSGTVFLKNSIRIGYLEQDSRFDASSTVYEAMKEVFAEDERLLARLAEAQRSLAGAEGRELAKAETEIERLNAQIAARDSYRVDVRIKTVLNGMGFENFYDQIVSTMSGGEKTRLKLCRLLLEEPDLLILDEPTNHLDVKTLFWLEDYLKTVKSALLVVSHDRYFLDRLTDRTLELERGKLTAYKGGYSKYLILKEEKIKQELRAFEKQQEEIARLKDYVDKNLVRATTAKSAQSRVNRLDRIELLEKPSLPPPPPRYRFSYAQKPYETVIKAEKFDLFAEGKLLIQGGSFTLTRGEKCALVGENGTGKTTLLKFLKQESREVTHGKFAKIAYFDQESADLPPQERVLDFFWGEHPLMPRTEAQKLLAQAGLSAEDADKKIEELSGGLRAKLALTRLEAAQGNVLILDEPTNHLDLPARESLEEALEKFDGTVLFVSHDRRFIERVATKIALIEDKTLSVFEGSYAAFLEKRALAEKKEREDKKQTPPPERKKQTGSYRSKEERAQDARRAARVKEIEKRLEALESEEEAQNRALAENAADYQAVRKISERLKEIRMESDALYAEYETLI